MIPTCRDLQELKPLDPQEFKTPRLVIPGFRPSKHDVRMVYAQHTSITERMGNWLVIILRQQHDVAMLGVGIHCIRLATKVIRRIINSK